VDRVQSGLFHLQKGLSPFVEARMKAVHGPNWLHYASRAAGGAPNASLDAYGLVKTMIDRWREVFADAFGRNDAHKARNFTSMALDARNAVAHLAIGLQDDEALRYLDAMHQLLKLTKASDKELSEVKKLYDAQRNSGSARVPMQPSAPAAVLDLGNGVGKSLKPWVEVALPHPDVIANRFKQAEFAADLFAVDSGHAGEGYATPAGFFGITFLTEGLRRVLTSAAQRLGDTGGDPVIGLQTAFGGGKTHTMLAIYHLAKHLGEGGDPKALPGLGPVLEQVGAGKLPKPKLAVFVGSAAGPDVSLKIENGPRLQTVAPGRREGPGHCRRGGEGADEPWVRRSGRAVQTGWAQCDLAGRAHHVWPTARRRPL
jgi:hypothetical protein